MCFSVPTLYIILGSSRRIWCNGAHGTFVCRVGRDRSFLQPCPTMASLSPNPYAYIIVIITSPSPHFWQVTTLIPQGHIRAQGTPISKGAWTFPFPSDRWCHGERETAPSGVLPLLESFVSLPLFSLRPCCAISCCMPRERERERERCAAVACCAISCCLSRVQNVTHPSTGQTQRCLTSVISRELVSMWLGRRPHHGTLFSSKKSSWPPLLWHRKIPCPTGWVNQCRTSTRGLLTLQTSWHRGGGGGVHTLWRHRHGWLGRPITRNGHSCIDRAADYVAAWP